MPFALALAALMLSPSAIMQSDFIYEVGLTPSCHASTIVETSPGHLVAAWFGGTNEGNPDVCIYLSRRSKRGTWSVPNKVADGARAEVGQRYPCYNPVLFQPRHGPLMLFYKVGPDPSHWRGYLKTSLDGGVRWSKPKELPAGILGPIKNKPVQLGSGLIVCPCSEELGGWTIHFEYSPDLGSSWSRTPPLNDPKVISAIQPSILRMADGSLRAIGRTKQGKLFCVDGPSEAASDRTAPQLSWGPVSLIDVPNPDSGIDAVTLKDGRHLMIYNPTTNSRTPLSVALSPDGTHWRRVIELEAAAGEYSYPSVIQAADGAVHVTYTWRRTRIKHVVLDPKQLL